MPIPPHWSLSGKVAILTADSRGWAPVLARALGEAGAHVAVAGETNQVVDPALEAVRAAGSDGLRLVRNFGRDEIAAAVQQVTDDAGRLDILVNAAQIEMFSPALETSDLDWVTLMDRNVRRTFLWCQAAARRMMAQRSGRIINVTSGLALRGLAGGAAYGASQAAVHQMTQSLALEWARSGIRVNGIGTGWYEAERRPLEEQQEEQLVRYLPLRRKGHPTDVAALLVYLASNASDFVTGQTIFIDGGALAHA